MITLADIAEYIGASCPIISVNSDGVIVFDQSATEQQKIDAQAIVDNWKIGVYPQSLIMQEAIVYFKTYTNEYIQARIDEWNFENTHTGIRFDDIHSFPKYAAVPTDSRYSISMRFLIWNGAIWDTATSYMLNATTVPTEAEFKAILDGVVF